MKANYILIFTLTIIFFSCQKSGNGYVRGTVTDVTSGNGAKGVPVYLIRERRWAKGQSYVTTDTIDRTLTIADGTYKISFHKNRGWAYSYRVTIGESDKFITDYHHARDLDMKKTAVNFYVYATAFAKVKITKTTTNPTMIGIRVGTRRPYYRLLDTALFTDSIVPFVFKVRGNYNSKACVEASYINSNTRVDYCSPEMYIQVGDTAIFSITYD